MSAAPCYRCRQPAEHLQSVTYELAFLHEMLTGAGFYIAPGEGYVLPVCDDCGREAG